ncbi:phage holin family protein [Thalassorhabdomicrobium marinisediminis]|uniref:phage holin family protein n=1 Tax=Thalassorhabdomicrobium marinisediminis TaxID=2170577 RepID=UPI002492FC30|nr:phage holin family protein [Thalassorhabdomicrobium marinisediminis]
MTPHKPDITDAPSLLSRLMTETKMLVVSEVKLAKQEVSDKLTQLGVGAGMLVGAALIAFTAFHALAAAAVFGLMALDIAAGWAVLIVALILVAIALVLFFMGKSRIKAENLKPKQTLRNIKADIHTIKEAPRA